MLWGILFYDETGKLTPAQRVEAASQAFERRFEMPATHARIPRDEEAEVPGLVIQATKMMLPHHALAGIPTMAEKTLTTLTPALSHGERGEDAAAE
jgi:hypothetical protein